MGDERRRNRRVGYAVIGLGHIAQAAVLPAFAHARRNSRLVALVSGDPRKQKELGRRYRVPTYSYDALDECLVSPDVEAVYVALPNNLHAEVTLRAAKAGVHVLCEKPMALSERECLAMIRACQENDVRLMIGYRLHFEEANLRAIEEIRTGRIGEPKMFTSAFSFQVSEGNIRTQRALGGGPLWDIGIYCVNAARYLFRDEPTEVVALSLAGRDSRFAEVEESAAAALRFSGERLAAFNISFGASGAAFYDVVGTEGELRVDNAYFYEGSLSYWVRAGGKETVHRIPHRDQFGPELFYFSDCILEGREPEPDGWEGLADVRIINALHESIRSGRAIAVEPVVRERRPTAAQEIRRPPLPGSPLVNAEPPIR